MSPILRLLALVAAAALVLGACAEDEPTELVEDTPPADEEPVEDPVDEPDPDGASVALATTDLGDVLVDGEGMTLYLFEPDEQGPSTCYDDCAEAWPPLLTDADPVAGAGADEALVGTAERDDGTTQVTYDGWPLYHWAGDESPGDTSGQGVQDVWWVVAADGSPVRDAAAEADAEEDPGY